VLQNKRSSSSVGRLSKIRAHVTSRRDKERAWTLAAPRNYSVWDHVVMRAAKSHSNANTRRSVRGYAESCAWKIYYIYAATLNRLLPEIWLDGVRLRVFPSVYKPLENEHRLSEMLVSGRRVLDLGCGSGVLSVFAVGGGGKSKIAGLSIRYAESAPREVSVILLSPWPESLYTFEQMWSRLAEHAHLVAIELPGFGHSEWRNELLTSSAMGEFIAHLVEEFAPIRRKLP
jgi:hypothetical protein